MPSQHLNGFYPSVKISQKVLYSIFLVLECLCNVTKYMPSAILGVIFFEIEPISRLLEWDSFLVL